MIFAEKPEGCRVHIKSWCREPEEGAMEQARNLASHPAIFHHVALMPDAHQGYGMPIGGVIAMDNAICPNAVGVDAGCGVAAIRTNVPAGAFEDMRLRRELHDLIRSRIPVGEGRAHASEQEWEGFHEEKHLLWPDSVGGRHPKVQSQEIDRRNLGTLGGGNHFIEVQREVDRENPCLWLMLHSGSRNLGHRIATHFHQAALDACRQYRVNLPDENLAFLPVGEGSVGPGNAYLAHMNFALRYALESRRRMMDVMFDSLGTLCVRLGIPCETLFRHDIHHNYAAIENHFGRNVWVHRKGATSAKKDEIGMIPGSMGTASYIVRGLGNPESFCSCSHGAGRRMSRTAACQNLTVEECDRAMEGIVCGRWGKVRHGNAKGLADLSEAPGAYKDIDAVIADESDLVTPETKLLPMLSIKG